MIASQEARPSKFVVAVMRPRPNARATRSLPMWRMYDSPRASASGFLRVDVEADDR